MGSGAVRAIYLADHAIANGDDFSAAGRAEVEAKVQTLSCLVGGAALVVRAGGVAIGLTEQPGIGAGWRGKRQAKRRRIRWLSRQVIYRKTGMIKRRAFLGIKIGCS